MAKLTHWEELLSFETLDAGTQYGPHTQAVANCFATLETVSWFAHVGADHVNRPEERVDTWSDAVEPLMRLPGYDADGHLLGPSELIGGFRGKRGTTKYQRAALPKVADYADYIDYIPPYFEKPQLDFLKRYLFKYLEHLVLEILTADQHDCTFYREQLTWFEAGHFPCGWSGEWPNGCLRVF